MYFKKLYLRLKHKRMLAKLATVAEYRTEREQCLTVLTALNVQQFALYQTSAALGVMVESPHKSIDGYTELMRTMARDHKKGKTLQAMFPEAVKQIKLDTFFVSKSGHYQDVEKAVSHFRQAGIDLCAALEDTDEAEYGVGEYNKRATTVLLANVRMLAITLAEVSLSN